MAITLITGGQRSGKSRFSQENALKNSKKPVYLATARVWDKEFEKRIQRHQSDRGGNWETIEEEKFISKHNLAGRTVVLDCITLWLTNFFHDNSYDVEKSLNDAKNEWEKFISARFEVFVISNEIGMGIIPENEIARKFADLQGWMNQYIASRANNIYLMVSGYHLKIK